MSDLTADVAMAFLQSDATAAQRIASQDTTHIYALLTQQAISKPIYDLILSQLGKVCGAPELAALVQLTQKGVKLLQKYTSLTPAQQLSWIRDDLRLREAIDLQDDRLRNEPAAPEYLTATAQRTQINRQQIMHLKAVEAGLVALLSPQPPSIISMPASIPLPPDAGYLAQMLAARASVSPELNKLLGAVRSKTATAEQYKAFDFHVTEIKTDIQLGASMAGKTDLSSQRPPLQPLSTNSEPPHLKRKRQQTESNIQDPHVLDDAASDDEVQIQEQMDVLKAKIAAIRSRTAHEDELMPEKKAKSRGKQIAVDARVSPFSAARLPALKATNSQHASELTRALSEDPFRPPKSSQNVVERQSMVSAAEPSPTTFSVQNKKTKVAPLNGSAAIPDAKRPTLVQATSSIKREKDRYDGQVPELATTRSTVRTVPPQPVVDLTCSSPPPEQQPPAATPISEPILCTEQQEVVDLILAGYNVFYTGSAGCGKSTVLKSFVPKLRDLGKCVKIVAPTGKAALDINGSTTWTYAGWTPASFKKPLADLVKAAHGKFVRQRFKDTDVLVIDEISMVENHMLQRLDAVMKEARSNAAAFGGVQVIVTGDFCQLPPVKPFQFCIKCGREQTQRSSGGKVVYRCPQHGDCNDDDKWAFRSAVWEQANFRHVNLTKIHRQSDKVFIEILQKLRVGTVLTTNDRRILLEHPSDVTNAVKLFPRRMEVKRINDTEFDRLQTPKHSYTCLDYFYWNETHGNLQSKGYRNRQDDSLDALREHRLETMVEYKVGMLVVLLVNLDIAAGLVNGSQGRIVGFERHDPTKLPKATVYEGGNAGGSRMGSSQRKSASGRSRSGRFTSGSRRSREDSMEPPIAVMGELRGEHALLRESQIQAFLQRPCNASKQWPIVEFDSGLKRTIYADCQVNELGDEKPYTLLARTQIPLIAAWAMVRSFSLSSIRAMLNLPKTIHKSQGMTLNKVIADLGNCFEIGQEYVASSRARSLDGLKVVSLGAGFGKGGNEQVREFYWRKFKLR